VGIASIDVAKLSPEERLQLIDEIWDSLSAEPASIPVTDPQREELDRRLDDLDRDGPVGIPWDEVLTRLLSR
jgi:putative addiction module component (TIGR02574 family)